MSSRNEKYIWGLFAGRCAMCKESLIHEGRGSERSLVGEVAHIVGEKPTAARGHDSLDLSARNDPDNLILLCRRHHKIIDDNEGSYSVSDLRALRRDYLDWLAQQLEPAVPWRIQVSAFLYLNVPRLAEYAEMQGFKLLHDGPSAGQALHELGIELNRVMRSFRGTLENLSIVSVPADRIEFAHEGYVGEILHFDKLRFRTKNMPGSRPRGAKPFNFTGNLARDPHVYHSFRSWKLVLNIDPRWITTNTAYTLFRPTSGHSLFTGFARITHVDLKNDKVTATALAIGLPTSTWNALLGQTNSNSRQSSLQQNNTQKSTADVDLKSLEDDATKSRRDIWHGDLECCDFCGRLFAAELYMVDGPMTLDGLWGCMCSLCYSKNRLPLGVGKGQLYRRSGKHWKLVGGYPVEDTEFD